MTANCGHIREILSGALDGVFLGDHESDLMNTHLADCSECRDHQKRLEGAVSLLQNLPYLDESPSFLGKLDSRLLALESEPMEAVASGSSRRRALITANVASPCDDFLEHISGSLDSALLPSEEDEALEHLESCAPCTDYQSRLSAQKTQLENFSLVEPAEDFMEWLNDTLDQCAQIEREVVQKQVWGARIHWMRKQTGPLLRMAAAVLLLVGAVTFFNSQMNPPKKNRNVVKNNPKYSPPKFTNSNPPDINIIPKPKDDPEKPLKGKEPEKGERPQDVKIVKNPEKDQDLSKPDHIKTPVEKDPKDKPNKVDGTTIEKASKIPAGIDLATLDRLLKEIADRRTPVADRNAKLASLAAYPHKRTYGFLSGVMTGKMDDYNQSQTIYSSACAALAGLDNKAAAEVLWTAPIQTQKRKLSPTHVSQAAARFKNADAIQYLASRAANDFKGGERPHAFIAGLSWRDNSTASLCFNNALVSRTKSINSKKMQVRLVNQQLALALGRIGTKADLTLLTQLSSSKMNRSMRLAAIEAIGDLQHPEAAKALKSLTKPLSSKGVALRKAAARAISRYTDPKAITLLIEQLGNEGSTVVTAAIRNGLFQLTGLNKNSHAEWAKWWKENKELLNDAAAIQKLKPGGVHALFDDECFGIPEKGRCSLFMLDCSSSMGYNSKFKRSVAELQRALRTLLPTKRNKSKLYFNVRLFADTSRPLLTDGRHDFFENTPYNINKACKLLDRVRVQQSATDIILAFEKAFRLPNFDTIYLISDGMSTVGRSAEVEQMYYEIHRLNRARRASIHTIGIYNGKNPLFLDLRLRVNGNEGIWKGFLRRLAEDNAGFFVGNFEPKFKAAPKKKKP
jgi:HEAT repeat protein